MNLTRFALFNRTFVLSVIVVLVLAGANTFLTMPRREDPEIVIRTAVVTTTWPGATAAKVEDLVTDPLETAIKKMDGVDEITSDSRTGLSIVFVTLDDAVVAGDVDQYWDELRVKIDQTTPRLPDGCGTPAVNSDFGDVYVIVFALHQIKPARRDEFERQYTYRELEVFAETVEDELKNLPQVAKIDLMGIQEERIYLEVDPAEWGKIALKTDDLRMLLESRNIVASGGEVDGEQSRYTIKPTGEFTSVDEIADVLVGVSAGGAPIRLGDLPVDIVRDYVDPMSPHFRFVTPDQSAERCVLIAVAMKSAENIVRMGEIVAERIQRLREKVLPPDLRLVRINDLPVQVSNLVSSFVENLWQAILIVLLVALVMMGWRPALIMAAAGTRATCAWPPRPALPRRSTSWRSTVADSSASRLQKTNSRSSGFR